MSREMEVTGQLVFARVDFDDGVEVVDLVTCCGREFKRLGVVCDFRTS